MGNRRTFDFAAKFVELGHKVTIISSSFIRRSNIDVIENKGLTKSEIYRGVTYLWLKGFPKYYKNDYRRLLNMLFYLITSQIFHLNGEPDIIIGSSPTPFAAFSGWMWAKRLQTKFVFEVRDLWPQVSIDLGMFDQGHPLVKFSYLMEEFLYSKAHLVITSLPLASKYFQKRGFNTKKLVHIPNGIDLNDFQESQIQKKIKDLPTSLVNLMKGLKVHDKKSIICIGALAPYCGAEVVLKAAFLIKSIKGIGDKIAFIFVGDGPEKDKLLILKNTYKLENVFFYPSIHRTLVPSLLSLADFAIFSVATSSYGAYGFNSNKLYDYLAAGVPVIFAAEASNNPVNESGCGISTPTQDPKAIVEAIKYLLSLSSKELDKMKKRGRQYMLKYHDLSMLAHQYVSVLKGVLKNK